MRRGGRLRDLAEDVGAGAEAGIQQATRGQHFQDSPILRQMRRLHSHFAIPIEAEPRQVLQDRGGELGAAACRVDILQAQQKPPAVPLARGATQSAR